jgi:hypothetical protein
MTGMFPNDEPQFGTERNGIEFTSKTPEDSPLQSVSSLNGSSRYRSSEHRFRYGRQFQKCSLKSTIFFVFATFASDILACLYEPPFRRTGSWNNAESPNDDFSCCYDPDLVSSLIMKSETMKA